VSSEEIHKNDVGTVFELTVKDGSSTVNLSSATKKQIIFSKPDATTSTKTASFKTDGTDGILSYVTVAGDLDQSGDWQVQAYVEITSGKWHSDVATFTVYDNLA